MEVTDLQSIGLVITGALIVNIKKIIDALGEKFSQRIKKDVKPELHPIINDIEIHLSYAKYEKYSDNAYKNELIRCREKVFWENVLNNVKNSTMDNIAEILYPKEKLIKAGISEKAIDIMQESIHYLTIFVDSHIRTIKNDSIYESENERLWATFSILHDYLRHINPIALEALKNANGRLYGDVFNGIENKLYISEQN